MFLPITFNVSLWYQDTSYQKSCAIEVKTINNNHPALVYLANPIKMVIPTTLNPIKRLQVDLQEIS